MKISEIYEDAYEPKQILSKSDQAKYTKEKLAEVTAEFIKKNCQPWLFESQGGIVYRGIDYSPNTMPVFKKKIRPNRKPKDSSQTINDAFNLLIDIAGGGATRNNSMFVSGSRIMAGKYGYPYIVFPVGDFHYTWSPLFKDWFQDLVHGWLRNVPTAKLKNLMVSDVGTGSYMDWSEVITDPNSYDFAKVKQAITPNQNLPEAIESKKEIMINASQAVYIDPRFFKTVRDFL